MARTRAGTLQEGPEIAIIDSRVGAPRLLTTPPKWRPFSRNTEGFADDRTPSAAALIEYDAGAGSPKLDQDPSGTPIHEWVDQTDFDDVVIANRIGLHSLKADVVLANC